MRDKAGALPRYLSDFSPLHKLHKPVFVPAFTEVDAEYRGFLKEVLDRVGQASTLAAREYVPKYYDGKITLFTAVERFTEPNEDEALGWRAFARQVEIVKLPGSHTTFLTGLGRDIAVAYVQQVTAVAREKKADLRVSEPSRPDLPLAA